MQKIIKIFLLLLVVVFSMSMKADCTKWAEELIASQTPQKAGNKFPTVTYDFWDKHEIGKNLVSKSITYEQMDKAIFVVVPGAFTPTCTSKHIRPFVDAYDKEESLLSKNKIPTFIIARDNVDVMTAWAKSMGINNNLLNVIPDPDYKLLGQLGLLEQNSRLGLIGKRSIFYVKDGIILDLKSEEANSDVKVTSVQQAEEFWSKHLN